MNNLYPTVEKCLPEFTKFVKRLSEKYERSEITSWDEMISEIEIYFTLERLQKFEQIIPEWIKMASIENGKHLIHTICVLVAIIVSPEYRSASEKQQHLMEWSALLHDISKQEIPDLTHAFRSAADSAKILVHVGFEWQESNQMNDLLELIKKAIVEENGRVIQDNTKLPNIIEGIDVIFGSNQAAKTIIKAILWHQSFTVIKDWPSSAPLTDSEIQCYVNEDVYKILRALQMADSSAWHLFDDETKERYRQEILLEVERISKIIESAN